jgi:hypothetical protein
MGFLQIKDKVLHRKLHVLLRIVGIIAQIYNCQKSVAMHSIEFAHLLNALVSNAQ